MALNVQFAPPLIKASTWLIIFDADSLRYSTLRFFLCALMISISTLEDFVQRDECRYREQVAAPCLSYAGFINKRFDGVLASELADPQSYKTLTDAAEVIR
ncbi:hypothetical protein ACNKHX_13115 [Shigella flexneri]